MKVCGIDVGFSEVSATSAYCIVEVVDDMIQLIIEPTKFCITDYPSLFSEDFISELNIITIDAPLTESLISSIPKSGRRIDKIFSGDIFNNSKRGPQPGSISTPKQGWPLYLAGMELKQYFGQKGYNFFVMDQDSLNFDKPVLLEVIPKLTQALLASPELVASRPTNKQIDDFLFAHTFDLNSAFRKCFGKTRFSGRLESCISLYTSNPKKYHEELAALIAALQGALYSIRSCSVIGFIGETEGHYLLPPFDAWSIGWKDAFIRRTKEYASVIKISG